MHLAQARNQWQALRFHKQQEFLDWLSDGITMIKDTENKAKCLSKYRTPSNTKKLYKSEKLFLQCYM
jgi:hypothetical protein